MSTFNFTITRQFNEFLMDELRKNCGHKVSNTAVSSASLEHHQYSSLRYRLASFSKDWAVGIQSWQLDILTGAQLCKLTD